MPAPHVQWIIFGVADRLRAFKLAEEHICPALAKLADDLDAGKRREFGAKGTRERGPGLQALKPLTRDMDIVA